MNSPDHEAARKFDEWLASEEADRASRTARIRGELKVFDTVEERAAAQLQVAAERERDRT